MVAFLNFQDRKLKITHFNLRVPTNVLVAETQHSIIVNMYNTRYRVANSNSEQYWILTKFETRQRKCLYFDQNGLTTHRNTRNQRTR